MEISIIGTGYVGLVTGACLAHQGHRVVCVDIDREKVERINRGETPIHEPGLAELLQENVGCRLRATDDLRAAVLATDLTLIAVGTPFDGRAIDLTFVREASRQIGEALRDKDAYHVVAVKSTVVPGTTDTVVLPALEAASGKRAGEHFGVGMNPEFLSEGEAVKDFLEPDRLVLGGIDARTVEALEGIYAAFPGVDRLRTDNASAEMIKYAANGLQALLISFSNELANLCAVVGGTDIVDVMRGVHLCRFLTPVQPDGSRVWPPITRYLMAGCGFGGSCFPKDVKALAAFGQQRGVSMALMQATVEVNAGQPLRLIGLLEKHFPSLAGVRVAVLGLAFKPDTDDMRESPAIPVVNALLARGAVVRAYDPVAVPAARKVFGETVAYGAGIDETVDGAQAIVLVTRWKEFADLPGRIAGMDPPPLVVDGRRMLDPGSVARYEGIGR